MRDRLRLHKLDAENQKGPARPATARDTIPFPGSDAAGSGPSGIPHTPFHAWRPREDLGTIANAESALEHAERQLANLRAILGIDAPAQDGDDHRAA